MRTPGAVSSIALKSHDLIAMLGGKVESNTPDIFVTVGAKWLASFRSPEQQTVQLTADEYERLKAQDTGAQLETKRAVTAPPNAARPAFVIED